MTAYELMLSLHEVCQFRSTSRKPAVASNSELRRMLDEKAVRINGKALAAKDNIEFPITSIVMFKNKPDSRITLL